MKQYGSASTQGLNPINNVFLKHSKVFSYVALEMFHNTMFHFIETLKVRGQARNLKTGDISLYFQNKEDFSLKVMIFFEWKKIFNFDLSQLPGRLISPSDICKKLSHHFLLHFPIGLGSYTTT